MSTQGPPAPPTALSRRSLLVETLLVLGVSSGPRRSGRSCP
ncbi:hypothetical protein [Serinicoccus sp. CNJ-927]|nr:hypothetical protein [Serinicoccus sp. CNJ-927]